ncbi:hypothetical protein QUA26_13875 [Microcoleus sp. Pol12A4]|uniref:hypothetical protein n=1 Tax=unclassified Microcoleus TaxID=2642155 RepID=UPI002FD5EF12
MTNPVRCVVDASVGIKQFIPDPLSSKVVQLFTHLEIHRLKYLYPICFILSVQILSGSMSVLDFTLQPMFQQI